MSAYTTYADIKPVGDEWELELALGWWIGYENSNFLLIVPAGFKSDLATIPWLARLWLRTADARFAKASILHDYMLAIGFSRATASAEFYGALQADGVSNFEAALMGFATLMKRGKRR